MNTAGPCAPKALLMNHYKPKNGPIAIHTIAPPTVSGELGMHEASTRTNYYSTTTKHMYLLVVANHKDIQV